MGNGKQKGMEMEMAMGMVEQGCMTEDEFFDQFAPEGDGFWEGSLDGVDVHHVWSVMEGEHGMLSVAAGFHVVNVIAHYVTENPWVTGHEWAEFDDDMDAWDDMDDEGEMD